MLTKHVNSTIENNTMKLDLVYCNAKLLNENNLYSPQTSSFLNKYDAQKDIIINGNSNCTKATEESEEISSFYLERQYENTFTFNNKNGAEANNRIKQDGIILTFLKEQNYKLNRNYFLNNK